MCGMLSAEDIAAVKVAIITCNNPQLKREILCVPGSDYYISKSCEVTNKKLWDEIIEKKSKIILQELGVPAKLQEKVKGFVLLVGRRMLTWAEYHDITFGFSGDYSKNLLNSFFFTSKGIIDNKKVAEELMNDKNLSITQKYKLACIYCFTKHIRALYEKIAKEDKEEFYDAQNPTRIKQPGLVKFWSYYLMDDIDKLREDKDLSSFRLEKAIESGSKVAVEYCLEEINLSRKKDVVIDAAVEAVRNWAVAKDDWVAFRADRYGSKETWVPIDYYVDILCFLLSKMRDDQKIDFFKKDIEDVMHIGNLPLNENDRCSRVLWCFLKWPYQDYFMNTAELMWEFLPEMEYAFLLLRVCDKIETKYGTLEYGEDRSYNYRGLLKEFWCQSPERYKRYVFSNEETDIIITFNSTIQDVTFKAAAGVKLLMKLLTLRKFTRKDIENINLILASADEREKENIRCSEKWRYMCYDLIKQEEWELLKQFEENWFFTEEEADKFKRKLSIDNRICIDFVKNKKRTAAEFYIGWIASSENEINKLKEKMIHSRYAQRVCKELIYTTRDVKAANEFCLWFFSPTEDFKKKCIFSFMGENYCKMLALEDNIEVADKLIKWCFSSEEEIKEIKKRVAYRKGGFVCKSLISDYAKKGIFNEKGYCTGNYTIKFEGGKWEQVEKFLTWCFSSEKEIGDFKKNVLIGELSLQIHFNFIKCNRWEEAETYFSWLGLSAEEIRELKKDTLFNHYGAGEMFSKLMHSYRDNYHEYVDYGDKQEAIELLLRWYLTDEETLLKFKDEFECHDRGSEYEILKAMFKDFDLIIEQLLNDLDEEKREIKRKSNIFSQ